MSKTLNLKFPKQKFQIGDSVTINWSKKDYEGKSIRRQVIDSIMEEWRRNSLDNLGTELDRNFTYKFGSTKKTLKTYSDILGGKRACEGSVFKRHKDSKEWFKNSIEVLNNIKGAIIIGVKTNFHHLSKICPSNVSYVEGRNDVFYTYTVLLHGLCDNGENHVQFEIELFDHYMK